jgi:hypothetical protein
MSDVKKIKSALISVFHKDGLDEILNFSQQVALRPSSKALDTAVKP